MATQGKAKVKTSNPSLEVCKLYYCHRNPTEGMAVQPARKTPNMAQAHLLKILSLAGVTKARVNTQPEEIQHGGQAC